jgi:hypothetical protein
MLSEKKGDEGWEEEKRGERVKWSDAAKNPTTHLM